MTLRKRRLELLLWSFLLSLAYYPGPFGFLAWLALVRPVMIISSLDGRPAFNAAYFFAFFFNAFSLYWVGPVTIPGTISAVIIVAFYYTAVLMLFHRLHRIHPWIGFAALPFLWVGMEYFRTLSEFAFPWSDLGYTQSYYLYILQIVSVISVHGLSLIVVAVNVLLVQVLRSAVSPARRLTALFLSVAAVLLLVAYGWVVLPPYPESGDFKVALLQGAVPLEVKWEDGNQERSIELYDSLATSAPDSSVQLYIWPETSAPCYLSHDPGCRELVARIARRTHGYHLVGGLGAFVSGDVRKYYNSCFQFDPSGVLTTRYDKMCLVPFSEHVPYQDHVPFMQKSFLQKYLTFLNSDVVQWWSDFHPGDSLQLFDLPDARYGVLICFESTFPEFSRELIRRGADFLVGITNDTWFGRSVGIHMHSRIFVTRAVENRAWGARVANTGLSYIVDKYGRIRQELGLFEAAAMTGGLRKIDGFSVFTRYGDVAGKLSFLFTLLTVGILVVLWISGKLRRGGRSAT